MKKNNRCLFCKKEPLTSSYNKIRKIFSKGTDNSIESEDEMVQSDENHKQNLSMSSNMLNVKNSESRKSPLLNFEQSMKELAKLTLVVNVTLSQNREKRATIDFLRKERTLNDELFREIEAQILRHENLLCKELMVHRKMDEELKKADINIEYVKHAILKNEKIKNQRSFKNKFEIPVNILQANTVKNENGSMLINKTTTSKKQSFQKQNELIECLKKERESILPENKLRKSCRKSRCSRMSIAPVVSEIENQRILKLNLQIIKVEQVLSLWRNHVSDATSKNLTFELFQRIDDENVIFYEEFESLENEVNQLTFEINFLTEGLNADVKNSSVEKANFEKIIKTQNVKKDMSPEKIDDFEKLGV